MKPATARLLLFLVSGLGAAAEPRATTTAGQDRPGSNSSHGALPDVGLASLTAILAAGVAAAAFMFTHRRRRRQTARQPPAQRSQPADAALPSKQQHRQQQQQQIAGLPSQPTAELKPLPPQSSKCGAVVEVAVRATSLQPPPSAPKSVNLQASHSMPAAVSPFACNVAAAQPPQASRLAATAAQPAQQQQQQQQSPFAASAAQPGQPKQLSPFAGAAPLQAAPAAAVSPFASAAVVLNTLPSKASADTSQLPSSSGTASELGRRPSPPHLSTMLDALPIFAAVPGAGSPAQRAAAGPAASPPAAVQPSQRARSPGGRQLPPPAVAPDRISLEQLRSEILGDDPLGGVEAQLESLLSTGLPAVGPVPAGAAAALDVGPQAAGGSSAGALQAAPSAGLDSADWEIAPNELEICKRADGSLWQLGAGGFGRVYKAVRFGVTPVAVKVMAPTGDPLPSLHEDFKREARLLQRCKDPHIVSFLGASLNSDFTILVTEYCEGGSLSANLAAGKISWYRHGKQVALDVARGLVFLHNRNIVHFDLKPPNILLDRRGTAKIADLGLAKIMHHERSWVSGNLGTLNWAAPELLLGQPCNEKADIFSFGCMLHEICTGAVPVRGRMRPLDVPTDCPAEVAQLVEQCMSPDPQARPTAQQLAERLLVAPGSPVQGTASAAGARRAQARRSMEASRPAGQAAAAAALARRGSELGSRVSSAGELASPNSPSSAMGRPPRPRSEANLPALAAQHAAAAPQAGHAPQPTQPTLPAVREDSEHLQSQQAQQAARPPSPRPISPLAQALSVASDSALTGATAPAGQAAAAVVKAQQLDRGTSLPVPAWGDAYGLGFC